MARTDTSRRDAWRDGNRATTVTGESVHDRKPDREHEGEDIHLPDTRDLSTDGTTAEGQPVTTEDAA